MKPDQVNLFRTLEPPSGGVERFRRRLENADAAAQRRQARPVLAAGLAAALIAVVVISFDRVRGIDDLQRDNGSGPSTAESSAPTANDASPASEVPSTTDRGAQTGAAVAPEFRTSPAFARLLGQPAGATETRISVDDKQVAVAEIPSTNSKIRIYEIRDN